MINTSAVDAPCSMVCLQPHTLHCLLQVRHCKKPVCVCCVTRYGQPVKLEASAYRVCTAEKIACIDSNFVLGVMVMAPLLQGTCTGADRVH